MAGCPAVSKPSLLSNDPPLDAEAELSFSIIHHDLVGMELDSHLSSGDTLGYGSPPAIL
jgi:hypothetical protein